MNVKFEELVSRLSTLEQVRVHQLVHAIQADLEHITDSHLNREGMHRSVVESLYRYLDHLESFGGINSHTTPVCGEVQSFVLLRSSRGLTTRRRHRLIGKVSGLSLTDCPRVSCKGSWRKAKKKFKAFVVEQQGLLHCAVTIHPIQPVTQVDFNWQLSKETP
jgi:hypothetical protein